MKPPVKTPAFLTIFFFSFFFSNAQLKINSANTIAADIKKVISDYPVHFDNILGEMIVQNPQSADYHCNFNVNGAEQCVITKYSGGRKDISSWQAVMLTTEDFNVAKKRFKSLYTQINNLPVNGTYIKGIYEDPVEERKYFGIIFSFNTQDETLKKLKVELIMEAEAMEWKVKILIYDREREDSDAATEKEE